MEQNGLGASASGTGLSQVEPVPVSPVPASIPDVKWPTWAAAVWCEAFVNGSFSHVMSLKFLRAPDKQRAESGAERMLRDEYPKGSEFQALVREVPAVASPCAQEPSS